MNDESVIASMAANMVTMWTTIALACDGGRVKTWPDGTATGTHAPNLIMNRVTVTDPAVDALDLQARAAEFFGEQHRSWGIVDPWGVADFSGAGFEELLRLPVMVRSPGPPPDGGPAGLRVERVTDRTGLTDFKRVLFRGFDLVPWPDDPTELFGVDVLTDAMHLYVGYASGEPAGCSVGVIAGGVVGIYLVATIPGMRGRGIGEAVTWAATMADPSRSAVLQASAMGAPVYERMGFRSLSSIPVWRRPPS